MSTLQRFSFRASMLLLGAQAAVSKVFAAQDSFGGDIPAIPGTPDAPADEADIRAIILDAVTFVLNFLALLAVIFIIISGIRLIVSGGNEDAKNKAKTTILYVIAGLLVVLFARVIVGFFAETVPDAIS